MRKILLTLFLAPMLLFSFTAVFGQSINNLIDMNATFTVNTEVHSVQNTLEGGPIEEVFGLNQNMFGPSGTRGRGNIFFCTTPRKLIEHRLYLNPTAPANMWFVVYEGASPQGNYNLVHSINVPNQGPGEAWYSSGAIDFDFQAGIYYAIYTQWDVNANYWNEQGISPYPIAASFGELQSGVGWNWAPTYGDPPPITQDVQEGFVDPVAYYQTIVTDDIGGGIDPALSGVCYATLGSMGPDAGSLITIDLATGTGTIVGPSGLAAVPSLAINSAGEMFATEVANPANLYRIDATTGTATLIGNTGLFFPDALAFDANDVLYTIDSNNDLYTLDPTTGAAAFVVGVTATIRGMEFDPTTGILWGGEGGGGGNNDGIYTIDLATGTATLIGNTGLGSNTPAIHFDAAGNLYGSIGGGMNPNDLISIDKATGIGTVIGPIGFVAVAGMSSFGGIVSIAYAIEDLDGDFIPDHLGETVTVEGVVFSPNFQTTNNSFYIWDDLGGFGAGASRGTDIFMFGPPVFDWQPGDLLKITGEVDQFNGMTEIIPADESGWVLVSSGNPTPDPIVLTLAQYKADPEAYEGSLVGFISLTLVGGTWPPAGGSSVNLDFSDGIDTCVFRIDSDTDIPGQPEPIWPRDILGVGSQFDNSPPFDGGYQIFPRYYATDFLPPNTIPVELTSFTAQVSNRVVTLNWTTATELNNQMFEIERRSEDGQYIRIGYVNGHGTTTEPQEYSYIDNTVEIGTFFYRLKQIDFGGRYAYSDVVQVDVVAPANFTLEQNYPNPFNPSTKITFSLSVDSKVSLKVFDILGQEVTKLITTNMNAGVHEVIFNASSINSGVYFYQLEATASDGTNFISVKKMILTK